MVFIFNCKFELDLITATYEMSFSKNSNRYSIQKNISGKKLNSDLHLYLPLYTVIIFVLIILRRNFNVDTEFVYFSLSLG